MCGHYVGSRRQVIIIVYFLLSKRANTTATHVYALPDVFGRTSCRRDCRVCTGLRSLNIVRFPADLLRKYALNFVFTLSGFVVGRTMAKKGLKRKQKSETIKEEEPKVAALPLVRRSDEPVAKKVNWQQPRFLFSINNYCYRLHRLRVSSKNEPLPCAGRLQRLARSNNSYLKRELQKRTWFR